MKDKCKHIFNHRRIQQPCCFCSRCCRHPIAHAYIQNTKYQHENYSQAIRPPNEVVKRAWRITQKLTRRTYNWNNKWQTTNSQVTRQLQNNNNNNNNNTNNKTDDDILKIKSWPKPGHLVEISINHLAVQNGQLKTRTHIQQTDLEQDLFPIAPRTKLGRNSLVIVTNWE